MLTPIDTLCHDHRAISDDKSRPPGLHFANGKHVKLVIVHDWLTGMRGGEKCLEVICRRFPQARLFTLVHRRGSISPTIEALPITTSFLQKIPGARRHYRYLLPLMPSAVEQLRIPTDTDLVLSFSHAVAKSIRVPPGIPHVCYCFTPMRYAWHLRDDYVGATHEDGRPPVFQGRVQSSLQGARHFVLDRLREWDRRTSDRVTQFVASSRTVARRIEECYGRPSRVIYPPVDTSFFTPETTPREDFYLCVSALVPYKRIDLAIDACRRLGRKLVIIGAGPLLRRLRRGAGEETRFLGWCDNETIRDHMRRCRALMFPGREDFGIVPVEAQACGTPVIAYGRDGATETVVPGNETTAGCGVLFAEQSVVGLAQAIESFESGRRLLCPQLARRQAERFSAERYDREMCELLFATARAKTSASADTRSS